MNKIGKCIIVLLLSITLFSCSKADKGSDEFEEWSKTLPAILLGNKDYTLYSIFNDPSSVGIEMDVDGLTISTKEEYEESMQEYRSILKELRTFDYEDLNEDQKITYDVLENSLNDSINMEEHYYLSTNYFDVNNGVFRVLGKIIDCFYLSLLFLLTSIPVFTIGASFSAMYYTVQKVIKNDRGYIASEYWHSFKTNFKQGTIIWLIVLVVGIVLIGDYKIMQTLAEAGNPVGKIYMMFGIFLFMEIVWCLYVFPYLARFENKTKTIMKNAAFIAILNLPRTLLIIVLSVVFALATYIMPMLIIIVPALYTWLLSLIMEKIFRKYMSEEDKALEDEMNREYKN